MKDANKKLFKIHWKYLEERERWETRRRKIGLGEGESKVSKNWKKGVKENRKEKEENYRKERDEKEEKK